MPNRNPSVEDAPEEKLVRKAKAGDLGAFEALVNRHEGAVYSLALRLVRQEQDAQDVTQQAFLSAMQNLGGFRGDASFATWLNRIATHAALKVLRRRRVQETVSLEAWTEPEEGASRLPHPEFIADWRQSPEELVLQAETRRLLEAALDRLDEKHRLVFVLRDVQGFSIQETAQALGVTEANVKVRLLRARLKLREQLTRVYGDPARRVNSHVTFPHDKDR